MNILSTQLLELLLKGFNFQFDKIKTQNLKQFSTDGKDQRNQEVTRAKVNREQGSPESLACQEKEGNRQEMHRAQRDVPARRLPIRF